MSHAVEKGSTDGLPTIALRSTAADLVAVFAPSAGMIGCSLRHRGEELLGLRKGLKVYAETGSTMGIPFLHPWANRLAECGYRIAGRSYSFDGRSPLVRRDPNGLPIHGLLNACPDWEVLETGADERAARLITHLDFARRNDLLVLFPFPHEIRQEVTLADSSLRIRTCVKATGDVPVPVSFGYHPYFTLPGVARRDWVVGLPVRRRMKLDTRFLPTGEAESVHFAEGPLGDLEFDDVFSELEQPAAFLLAGGGRQITVRFGQTYPVAVVYAPRDQPFICFEPMTAPTNALLSGWPQLRQVRPGERFEAEFEIRVSC